MYLVQINVSHELWTFTLFLSLWLLDVSHSSAKKCASSCFLYSVLHISKSPKEYRLMYFGRFHLYMQHNYSNPTSARIVSDCDLVDSMGRRKRVWSNAKHMVAEDVSSKQCPVQLKPVSHQHVGMEAPCMAAMHWPLRFTHVGKQSRLVSWEARVYTWVQNMCCGQSRIKGQWAMLWTLQSRGMRL